MKIEIVKIKSKLMNWKIYLSEEKNIYFNWLTNFYVYIHRFLIFAMLVREASHCNVLQFIQTCNAVDRIAENK